MEQQMISRRTLLAAGAAAVARGAQQAPPGDARKVGYAVVGLGRIAQGQALPALAKCQRSRVTGLVSGDPAKAARIAAQYGVNPKNIYSYQNYDQMASNREIEAVYIALPNGMHAEYTIRAHQAGKHVLSEKPMANTVEECRQMIDAARTASRKLMVAYRVRYEPYNMTAIKLVREEIGRAHV